MQEEKSWNWDLWRANSGRGFNIRSFRLAGDLRIVWCSKTYKFKRSLNLWFGTRFNFLESRSKTLLRPILNWRLHGIWGYPQNPKVDERRWEFRNFRWGRSSQFMVDGHQHSPLLWFIRLNTSKLGHLFKIANKISTADIGLSDESGRRKRKSWDFFSRTISGTRSWLIPTVGLFHFYLTQDFLETNRTALRDFNIHISPFVGLLNSSTTVWSIFIKTIFFIGHQMGLFRSDYENNRHKQ